MLTELRSLKLQTQYQIADAAMLCELCILVFSDPNLTQFPCFFAKTTLPPDAHYFPFQCTPSQQSNTKFIIVHPASICESLLPNHGAYRVLPRAIKCLKRYVEDMLRIIQTHTGQNLIRMASNPMNLTLRLQRMAGSESRSRGCWRVGLGISEAPMVLHTVSQSGVGIAGASGYATQPVAKSATAAQIKAMPPKLINGEVKACFEVTEPSSDDRCNIFVDKQ